MIFRSLTAAEEATFRRWARDNYVPGTEVDRGWHPAVRDECELMIRELARPVIDE